MFCHVLRGESFISGVNPSGIIPVMIPATSVSGTKYKIRIDASNYSVTGNPSADIEVINGAKNITFLNTSPNSGEITLNWSNPAGCYDEIMIVAKEGSSISDNPVGDGSFYIADLNFKGNSSEL